MEKKEYLIAEAAKAVNVETHVLRYWEEELGFPIKRNWKGHRIYTQEDVDKFIQVKKLKEEGLQLKAVKKIIMIEPKDGNKIINFCTNEENQNITCEKVSEIIGKRRDDQSTNFDEVYEIKKNSDEEQHYIANMPIQIKGMDQYIQNNYESKTCQISLSDEKMQIIYRIKVLLREMISESVSSNNKKIIDEIKENISKEFDYQFRQFDEVMNDKMKQQEQRQEEHFRQFDETLRNMTKQQKRKSFHK